MAHLKPLSRCLLLLAGGMLSLVAVVIIVPRQLVAQEPVRSEKPKISGTYNPGDVWHEPDQNVPPASEATGTGDSGRLPGRIYTLAVLDITSNLERQVSIVVSSRSTPALVRGKSWVRVATVYGCRLTGNA